MAGWRERLLGDGENTMIALSIALFVLTVSSNSSQPVCTFERASLLKLEEKSFDQDLEGGWRKIAYSGCKKQAADLIRDWRRIHNSKSKTLYWHEGQLRAEIGKTTAAIKLFKKSIKTPEEDAGFGWNLYVEGSIAFLNRDKDGLLAARNSLAALPKPEGLDRMVDVDGNPVTIKWPMNLHVLEAFIACWDKPYSAAYRCANDKKS